MPFLCIKQNVLFPFLAGTDLVVPLLASVTHHPVITVDVSKVAVVVGAIFTKT